MPKRVKMPSGEVAEFPDDMKPEQIQAALEQHQQENGAPEDKPGFMANFGRSFLPSTTLSDYWEGPAHAVAHPMQFAEDLGDMGKAMLQRQGREFVTANNLAHEGRGSEAIGHFGAGMLPILGPAAADAGEQIGSGDVAGGLGSGAGIISQVLAPRVAGRLTRGVAPGYGEAIHSGAKTLPTIAPEVGALGGLVAGAEAGHPWLGMGAGRIGTGLLNKALTSRPLNKAVGYALGGGRGTSGAVPTLSPLESGQRSFPEPAMDENVAGPIPSLYPPDAEMESTLGRGVEGPTDGRTASKLLSLYPDDPQVESPLGQGVNVQQGGRPFQPEVPNLNAPQPEFESPLGRGVTTQPEDIVPGNNDTDVTELKRKYGIEDVKPEMVGNDNPAAIGGRAETVDDQSLLDTLRHGLDQEGKRAIKSSFEDAGQWGGHAARKGLAEGLTGKPVSDFGEKAATPEVNLEDKLKASLKMAKSRMQPNLTSSSPSSKIGGEGNMWQIGLSDKDGNPITSKTEAIKALKAHGVDNPQIEDEDAENGVWNSSVHAKLDKQLSKGKAYEATKGGYKLTIEQP